MLLMCNISDITYERNKNMKRKFVFIICLAAVVTAVVCFISVKAVIDSSSLYI